ncbi:hypothetical protein ACQEVZ_51105 [Dactylosporangium sp. CA-152071]|uniref:hypothetical protein n=1 Tax=Dactylosporangium sp. CA-152071 TaxID=3239933 RepID=UPI003D94E55C
MSSYRGASMARWWATVVVGAAAALLFAWLGKVAGVSLRTLLTVGAGLAALMWTVVLVTWPWNLYFDARHVTAEHEVSRARGIAVPPARDDEARRIARWMLRFAIGGHLATAAVTAVFAAVSGELTGYYLAGFYLLSTLVRPAAAYFGHLRDRITSLRRESTHPRDDVVTLNADVESLKEAVERVQRELDEARTATADDLARLRKQAGTDLTRLEDAQAADRAAARDRDEALKARIDQMARRVEGTLDGISDHQELLTGIRALVRMIRTDPA